jgi:hypothetical protein
MDFTRRIFCYLNRVRSISVPKMSFENTVSKLRSPARELVLSASENGGKLLGNDDNDKKEVIGWLNKLSQKAFVTESNIKVCPETIVAGTPNS